MMNGLISDAYAQTADAATAATSQGFMNLVPFVLILAVFYFLIIRPQQKKMRQHQEIINGLQKGDEVITAGGLIGKIAKVDDVLGELHVELAKDVIVRAKRSTISTKIEAVDAAGAKAKAESKESPAQSKKKLASPKASNNNKKSNKAA